MSKQTVYVSINLRTAISFETARNIVSPIKHYITQGGSDRIHILVVAEEDKANVIRELKTMGVVVR
jgi:hypothetical protein